MAPIQLKFAFAFDDASLGIFGLTCRPDRPAQNFIDTENGPMGPEEFRQWMVSIADQVELELCLPPELSGELRF